MKLTDEQGKVHYIDKKEFYNELVQYKKDKAAFLEKNPDKKFRVPETLGKKILLICKNLSYRYNFINYTYRDEMVLDGIENCLLYIDNFNTEKYDNPFAYFTTIAYYAFVRRINEEKGEHAKKAKFVHNMVVLGDYFEESLGNQEDEHFNEVIQNLQVYYNYDAMETVDRRKKEKADKKKKKKEESLKEHQFDEEFFDGEEE